MAEQSEIDDRRRMAELVSPRPSPMDTSVVSLPGCVADMPPLLGAVSETGIEVDGAHLNFNSPRLAAALLDVGLTEELLQPKKKKDHDAKGIVNGVVYSSNAVRQVCGRLVRVRRCPRPVHAPLTRLAAAAAAIRADRAVAAAAPPAGFGPPGTSRRRRRRRPGRSGSQHRRCDGGGAGNEVP